MLENQFYEFAVILAIAAAFGAIGRLLRQPLIVTFGLITLVGLITIGLSTYLILYSHPIYEKIAPGLAIFERNIPSRELGAEAAEEPASFNSPMKTETTAATARL